ncbi:MAG: PLP-dependent aminotransferase family protein [Scrofimicrobium sp.]
MGVYQALDGWSLNQGPLYERLATAIELAVERGDLTPGSLLPPERQLAQSMAVGRSTVVSAYDLLRARGVLTSRQGSGTWVSGAPRKRDNIKKSGDGLSAATFDAVPEVLDLATASLEAPGLLVRALKEASRELAAASIGGLGYEPLGYLGLRRALADFYTTEGVPTTTDQVLVTTGAQQALWLIAEHFMEPGSRVLVENPTSAGMLDLVRHMPATAFSCPSVVSHGASKLLETVDGADASVVYIMGAYGPEGRAPSDVDMRWLSDQLARKDVIVIEDISARDLSLTTRVPLLGSLRNNPRILSVGSMSKLFWGGLRVGWIRAEENTIRRLSRIKVRTDLGTPIISQYVSAGSCLVLKRFAEND